MMICGSGCMFSFYYFYWSFEVEYFTRWVALHHQYVSGAWILMMYVSIVLGYQDEDDKEEEE